ncbi:phosphate acetyltransferase [Propionivibrio dicarboxylicus]|uniref:Phosphate acetyltransferase n=1 Tax=Propionivibrio dicarboxylicus TaxID=83767 RepID=A0A1G8A9D8_9RHOO|nr:phosphate acetyltransferase [Propionivibrio dicarboxylicus]SDH17497.1 phosphate acetyltransferase [Propionivibrio dicarboxylicus]
MKTELVSRTLFMASASSDFSATTGALGLLRALQREGFKVGFVKPVADLKAGDGQPDRSVHFARTIAGVTVPEPISAKRAEAMVRASDEASLLEEIVTLVEGARGDCDLMIVEGITCGPDHPLLLDLDPAIARNLGAAVLVTANGRRAEAADVVATLVDAAHRYGSDGGHALAGAIITRVPDASYAETIGAGIAASGLRVPLVCVSPDNPELAAPLLSDVAANLGFSIYRTGDLEHSRIAQIIVASRGVDKLVERLKPGTLIVAPCDRSDLVVTATLARLSGMPIAGLLLTCGESIAPSIEHFLNPRFGDLPIVTTPLETYDVVVKLAATDRRISLKDRERMERVMDHIADHVALAPLTGSAGQSAFTHLTPPMFRHRLIQQARVASKRIVLPEGDEPRTIRAAAICATKGIAHCVLLGDPAQIHSIALTHGIDLPTAHPLLEILDPATIRKDYVAPMVALRKSKGLTAPQAEAMLEDNVVLGTMMLAERHVDGLVSGAVHTTASTVRPALQLIKTTPGSSIVSSVFFMLMPDQVLVYGDCAINPNPSAEELAEIALQSAGSAAAFGIEPRVAMISYSTGVSGTGDDVDKVRAATEIVRARRPELIVDGPIQYDAASVIDVARQKAPNSPLKGRATVFVFPDLNTGNTTYKAVQRSANVVSVGPMLQGLRKPVNDLSRGALVDDIVYTIALTAIQAIAEA